MSKREWPGVDWLVEVLRDTIPSWEKERSGLHEEPVVSVSVRMNDDEIAVAHLIADRRNSLNFGDKNFPDKLGSRLLQHRAAALAEMAVAKQYDRYWTGCGKGTEGLGDVGGKWEVRSIRTQSHGLIVRAADPERPHILVFVEEPVCTLLGWMWPKEARQDRYHRSSSPQGESAFWLVPQSDLHPIGGLE